MNSPSHVRAGLFAALATLGASGCGEPSDGLPRQPVSGTISLDGQPLPSGAIMFEPLTATPPVSSGGMIENGRYDIPRHQGLTPGKYQVRISSPPQVAPPKDFQLGDPLPSPPDRVPPQYNMKSILTADMKPGGPETFNFDLKTK